MHFNPARASYKIETPRKIFDTEGKFEATTTYL
jgi:hypothetical protein